MGESSGPYLQAALPVMGVEIHPDGAASLHRVVNFIGLLDDKSRGQVHALTIFLSFFAGGAVGTHEFVLQPYSPRGFLLPAKMITVVFDHAEHSLTVVDTLPIPLTLPGLYQVEVRLHDRVLTVIPVGVRQMY